MNVVLFVILAIVVALIIAVLLFVFLLRRTGTGLGGKCTAATGQCVSGTYCNSDGICVSGTGGQAGQTCTTSSECIYGLQCTDGTCQNITAATDLVPSGGTVALSSSLAGVNYSKNRHPRRKIVSSSSSEEEVNNSVNSSITANSDKFLLTSNGEISIIKDGKLYVENPVPDEKISDLISYSDSGKKPSYISSGNNFVRQNIFIETNNGRYYLQVLGKESYWIHQNFVDNAANVKFSYNKENNSLLVGDKKVYISPGTPNQIKFNIGKKYLKTDSGTSSNIFIERNSSGYFIRSDNFMYLTIDTTGSNLVYAKYPAVLVSLSDDNSGTEITYIGVGAQVRRTS